MNTKNLKNVIVVLFLLFAGLLFGNAAQYDFVLDPESKLWIEGDSTLHSYEAAAEVIIISGAVLIDEDLAHSINPLDAIVSAPEIKSFVLRIPVDNLQSQTGGLTNRMHKALKIKDNPMIAYTLSSYSSEKTDEDNTYLVKSNGILSIAGVDNPVNLTLRVRLNDGHILISGEYNLLMSDYGIKPPTVLGLLRTHDQVTVKWELKVGFSH